RYSEICDLLDREKAHFACLQETMLDSKSNIKFNNFHSIFKSRDRPGGGVGILIRQSIQYQRVDLEYINTLCTNNQVDIVIVKIPTHDYKPLHIISIYSPSRNSQNPTESDFWENLFLFCSALGNIIICGNFN
ncbi:hypothetical protein EAI_07990, partial [Harpegnathos saltator]